ncbi:MAG TPA: hypothetical protein VF077_08760 [Nitrospiraceae bacterium]
MPQYEPPPTFASPILVEKNKLTGQDTASFNPIWLKWFLGIAAFLGGGTGGGGIGPGLSLPHRQMIFGNAAGFADTSNRIEWYDDTQVFYIGNEAEVGTVSGGDFFQASRGKPGKLQVSGSPNPGSNGGFVSLIGGNAGTAGGSGGPASLIAGNAAGSGNGGSTTVAAGDSDIGGGNGGDVGIASGAGNGGGNSGNVILQATPVAGGGGARGYIFEDSETVRLTGVLVADLPAPDGTIRRAIVTDALGPVFNVAVVGGGAVTVPVFNDGTNPWKVG